MAASQPYADFTRQRAERNPCLKPLVELLQHETYTSHRSPTIFSIDYEQSPIMAVDIRQTTLEGVFGDVGSTMPSMVRQGSHHELTLRRLILVEDIDSPTMQALGSRLDIDPAFFAHYMLTELKDIASSPPPPALSLLPSTFVRKNSVHLHYQQILNLGSADPGVVRTYKFQSQANVKRAVRCPPPVSGIQLAIMRGCCSAILKSFRNGWICLVLVDSLSADLTPKNDSGSPTHMHQTPKKHLPLQGGFEDFADPAPFSLFAASASEPYSLKTSFLQNLLWYYEQCPPGLDLDNPSLLSLAYYPIRMVSSNWMLYVLLLNRYYKSYEYSVNKSRADGVLETDLIDLQRWRRRTKQSLSKLSLITAFIGLYEPPPQEAGRALTDSASKELSDICATLLSDYQHIINEIKDYRQGMDFLISISTAMFQLSVARQSIHEAINIRRLTYVALFSAPLGLVAAVFSMSADFLPGQSNFWVFVVTAVLATSTVVGVALIPGSGVQSTLYKWYQGIAGIRPRRLRKQAVFDSES